MRTLQQFIKDIVKLHIHRILSVLLLLAGCLCMLAYAQKHPQTAASEIETEVIVETEAAVENEAAVETESMTEEATESEVVSEKSTVEETFVEDRARRVEDVEVTVCKRLRSDMPEFAFTIRAKLYIDEDYPENNYYEEETLTISNGEKIQTIDIRDYEDMEGSYIGTRSSYIPMKDYEETLGLEFVDMNFDGYLDIRQYLSLFNKYEPVWLCFLWNPKTECFEYSLDLVEIRNASFDEDKKCVYGMIIFQEDYSYYTYRYMDKQLVRTEMLSDDLVWWLEDKVKKQCFELAGIDTYSDFYDVRQETFWKYNDKNGEFETIKDEYVFYGFTDTEILRIPVDSELGEIITQEKE